MVFSILCPYLCYEMEKIGIAPGSRFSYRSISRPDGGSVSIADSDRGFTLTEVIIVIYIICLLATIAISSVLDGIEKARLARCLIELRGIQTAVWMDSDDGAEFMDPMSFWSSHYHGSKPGPYYYLLDGDANKGHGNDLDGVDEENPGNADRDREDIQFVVLCQHDHRYLCDYVYLVDGEPPVIVNGFDGAEDPRYDRFIKWEFGGPGGGGGNGKKDENK